MEYVALLRGINVGGKSIIKMSDLKNAFENLGFKNVQTYINSGNVLFESDEKSLDIRENLEKNLSKIFNVDLRIVIKTKKEIIKVLKEVPTEWEKTNNLRCYIAFVRKPFTEKDVLTEVRIKEGVDFVKISNGVLYMSTLLSGVTKSGFTKLIGTKIYKDITIRNYNTVQKLLDLMENV
jgi:uncharacterized protein (DUF1697 family)